VAWAESWTGPARIVDGDTFPLVHCFVGDLDLGREMVRLGCAISIYGHEYSANQEAAQQARTGAWSDTLTNPADWRKQHPRRQAT